MIICMYVCNHYIHTYIWMTFTVTDSYVIWKGDIVDVTSRFVILRISMRVYIQGSTASVRVRTQWREGARSWQRDVCSLCVCLNSFLCVHMYRDQRHPWGHGTQWREGARSWQRGTCSLSARADCPPQTGAHIYCNTLQLIATHCNSLQHTATHCNTCATLQLNAAHRTTLQRIATQVYPPQHTVTFCNILQRIATYCSTLQCHVATHCRSLQHSQHTATHCNTLQLIATYWSTLQRIATYYSTLQRIATYCSTLQRIVTYCSTLKRIATYCRPLQRIVIYCSTLQLIATPANHFNTCNTQKHTTQLTQ